MNKRETLKALAKELIPSTKDKKARKNLEEMYSDIDEMDDSEIEELWNYVKNENLFKGVNPSIIPPEFRDIAGISSPNGNNQNGNMDVNNVIRYKGKDIISESKKVIVQNDEEGTPRIKEQHIKVIDCPHISRNPQLVCPYCDSLLCGDEETGCSIYTCCVCKNGSCRNCSDLIVGTETGKVYKTYHGEHSTWWYRLWY